MRTHLMSRFLIFSLGKVPPQLKHTHGVSAEWFRSVCLCSSSGLPNEASHAGQGSIDQFTGYWYRYTRVSRVEIYRAPGRVIGASC